MRFQRRGGRKRIVAPDGSEIVPTPKPQPQAHWSRPSCVPIAGSGCWRALSPAELPAAQRISRSYICRVPRLTLLASDIVERVMDGEPTAGLAQLLQPFPVEWEKQREQLLTR